MTTGPMTMTTTLARTRDELAAALAAQDLAPSRGQAHRRAVVMTMGALHAGHLSLVEQARGLADQVVVTVFVNPLQFAPTEDLARYPRDLDADLALLTGPGLLGPDDVVFAPDVDVMYPDGEPVVRVSAGAIGDVLEGEERPGHLDGVLTVVLKLLNLTQPDVALFGRKDAQQLAAIRRMVRDLEVGVEVVGAPLVRDDDGLALSSRNAYLTVAQRERALALVAALRAGTLAAPHGRAAVLAAARAALEPVDEVGYVAVVDPDTFADAHTGEALLLLAARVGPTRLIDNTALVLGADRREGRA